MKTLRRGGRELRCVEVTLADIALANQLAHEVLGRGLDELPPQIRKLLGVVVPCVAVVAVFPKTPAGFGVNRVKRVAGSIKAIFGNMTMHVNLPPDVESYINGQVKEGLYRSADEAVADFVRRARQADEDQHERLLKALAKGEKGGRTP